MAFAIYGMAVVLAPAIGPTLGGFITDHFSWRWIFFINLPVGVTSLVLSHRLVEDPPWLREQRDAGVRIDYVGLALIVIGLGCLQIGLDKGERDDWFSSTYISAIVATSGIALVAAIAWEWRHPRPIVELRLLRNRNFATACVMMFMLGAVLYGSTVLLPQYLQVVMGYTAEQSGMVLSPGGLLVIAMLPLVGRLLGQLDGRWLIAFGFFASAAALRHMTGIYPGISFSIAVKYRLFQSFGLAFLFIPITTLSYVGAPPEKNNQVSALTNLARNIGGAVGISLAQTLIARRMQLHQSRLVEHVTAYSPALRAAGRRTLALVYGLVQQQAATLAFIDTLWLLSMLCFCMVPIAFLMRRPPPGATPAMH
jgi:DHA2 family multidrug resistance protein